MVIYGVLWNGFSMSNPANSNTVLRPTFFLTLHIPNDWKEVFGVLGDVAFDLLQVVHIQPKPGGV